MRYPREVWAGSHIKGSRQIPRKLVRSKEAYLKWLNMNNGRMNCYMTVYEFERFTDNTKIDSSAILDRMFLDLDAHGEPLENAHRDFSDICKKFLDEGIKFRPYFSGKGFHIIVYGKRADDIRSIQAYYSTLAEDYPTLDRTGIQTTRLRRIPNTLNLSSDGYYCIPLDMSNMLSLDVIVKMAKKQVHEDFVFGSKLVDWPKVKPVKMSDTEIEMPDKIGGLPILPCLQNAITVENPSHYARVYLIQWYRDLLSIGERNISLPQQEKIVSSIMGELEVLAERPGMWLDWNRDLSEKYVRGIVQKGYHAPGCESVLIPQGYCIGRCWRYPDE